MLVQGKRWLLRLSLFASVSAWFQGALMVPTEILAEQHVESLSSMLGPVGVTCEFLTSSVKGKRRKEILAKLKLGEIDILIGTHALIQDEVEFNNLGLGDYG